MVPHSAKGIYTSISDLARAGTSILSSSLLSPSQTRRWLKPITHTSNSANSIGRPWEIYSGKASDDGTIMNVYTKLGTFGKYSSYIGLVSDYNVGFAILAADSVSAPDLNSHADIIGDALLPALIKAAARQAVGNSAGVFEDGNCGSMEIGIDGLPGFNVKELKRKNVDVRASIAKLKGIQPDALSFRLVPTGLESGGRIAFRAIWQDENEFADVGTST